MPDTASVCGTSVSTFDRVWGFSPPTQRGGVVEQPKLSMTSLAVDIDVDARGGCGVFDSLRLTLFAQSVPKHIAFIHHPSHDIQPLRMMKSLVGYVDGFCDIRVVETTS